MLKVLLSILLLVSGCVQADKRAAPTYDVTFEAQFSQSKPVATVTLRIKQTRHLLTQIDLNAPKARYTLNSDSKKSRRDGQRIVWNVPKTGGALIYTVQVDQQKGDAYDAKHTKDWAIMRLGDLFPPAKVRSKKGARSESTLKLLGPNSWRFETPYGKADEPLKITSDRNFARPTGWLVAGQVGSRRSTVAGHDVSVVAPKGAGFHRMDVLAFLNFTLPTVASIYPDLPKSIMVVGAPSIMWRGGLSAPNSLYMHVDRPLVSENGTSTLLHELGHLGGLHSAAPGSDWIVEGLAEYYALESLRRSGGITDTRYNTTLEKLKAWADREDGALTDPSKGANTAAAVLHFHALQQKLQQAGHSLDDVVPRLIDNPPIASKTLTEIVDSLL